MQPQPTRRRARPVLVSTMLMMVALTLALLAVVTPLGVAAADEKEDSRGSTRRVEPTATAVVVQVEAGAETDAAAAGGSGDGNDDGHAVLLLDEAVPPDPPGCPEGFVPALPPLNPALGCIANNIATSAGGSTVIVVTGPASDNPDPFCPPGFEPALPPLNPALGCVGTGLTLTTGEGESPAVVATLDESAPPGHGCPDGWVPALPPINPALRCINNTAGTGTPASGGTAQYVYVGSSSLEHPGHCAEGYSYRLVLRQNADGSLTWLYTCIPDGTGLDGPDDFTTGDSGRGGRTHWGYPKFDGVGSDL